YTHRHGFHEPFVLFGFLAAATRRVELVTGIIILPQRQTALVAKQAAAVDVLSGGRLRLGVAVGWNPVEFEALGEDFRTRGRRIEEQIEVMRLLWTRELVTFAGKHHRLPDAGLDPLPVQRPLPARTGGGRAAAARRRRRLEPVRVRGARRGLPDARPPDRGADRGDAAPVDARAGDVRGEAPPHPRRRPQPAPRATTDPGLDGRRERGRAA